ncbi:MAG: FAD-dependent monooxygenase [Saprospiraceae bacterium]|nr:FAD-dependent monooxygenase [Saprospiraceae bacterium]
MKASYEIGIVGGGLAGLTAGIHLSQLGFSVVIFERQSYPHHKVCGEYVSKEVLPYFDSLGIDVQLEQLPQLNRLHLTTEKGKELWQDLPLGGFGISRYVLDELLYKKALANGVQFVFNKVQQVAFEGNSFIITTSNKEIYESTVVLGAWGKRSSLDKAASRPFIQRRSPWMGVKAHFEGDFADDVIALHNFRGGYCGMSKVEQHRINACYLVDTRVFQEYGSVDALEAAVLMKNPFWAAWRTAAKPLFEQPLIISQISFERKAPIVDHMLMIGDSAGLIHPLCGNGMAMAIHAAKLAAEGCEQFFHQHQNRQQLERAYQTIWKKTFQARLQTGRRIQQLLLRENMSNYMISLAQLFPGLVPKIIKKTHGLPIG